MIRLLLCMILALQFLTNIVRADGARIAAGKNFVWGDIEILEVVNISRNFLASQSNASQWHPNTFSVFFEQEAIYVQLGQTRLGELPDSNGNVSAFFELRRSDYKITKFDLCSNECGLFRVRWFRQPEKIEFFLKKQ